MNERIRELAEKAESSRLEYNPATMMTERIQEFDKEKFAELIVWECARVVDIWSDEVPCSEGYDKFTVGKLKEHFGVEECNTY